MAESGRQSRARIAFFLISALALGQAGCLAAAATCAAGGVAGYAYYNAKVTRDFAANREDVWSALHASMRDLQMPIGNVESNDEEWVLESKTADGDQVRITLEIQKSPIQAEGNLTHVGVRIATFGDSIVSNRILDQIGLHLVPASNLGTPPPVAVGPNPQGSSSASGPQSPPPPLAVENTKK
ncbi:MAG: DUF3568 family protein [Gemmataceae bacterium]